MRSNVTAETREKMSLWQKGKPKLYMIGNKYRCGKKLSNEHKTKLIAGRKNMIITNEYKNKISNALKRNKNTLARFFLKGIL